MKTADMHCDTISSLYEKKKTKTAETLFSNSGHVDVEKLKKGDALLQNFALFVDKGKTGDAFEQARRLKDFYYAALEKNRAWLSPVYTWEDIKKNTDGGKISALLTVEEGAVCEGKTKRLHELYGWGVRMMTLTWNYENEIGFPNLYADRAAPVRERTSGGPKSPKQQQEEAEEIPFYKVADLKHGLKERGVEIVEEMERIGMIVDVSHLSDAGFFDVLTHTKKPFVASHSNARAVCPWVRNLTDFMIRSLAERGGVMGLNFCPDFLTEARGGERNPGTVAAVVAHARHIVRVGGIDCLGLGSDFDGIDTHEELPDYSFLPRLSRALSKGGFSQSEVEKIFCGNVLRLYRELL